MRFLSLFSGIEAASAAWLPIGWDCVGVAEVDPFACAVLAHRYPSVPNIGDVTKITKEVVDSLGRIDVVCGGFPCQDLSVAGKRKGLKHADGSATRSGLFFDAMRIAEWASSRWLVIENVPGMFSSNKGRDFAAVVGAMAGCEFDVPADGWQSSGVALGPLGLVEWTVLDAQYHGLAQRRRRVFIVRDSGDWASRAPIFLEPYRLSGYPAPRRETGQRVAGPIVPGAHPGGFNGQDIAGNFYAYGGNNTRGPLEVATARNACASASGRMDFESETSLVSHSLRGDGFDASEDGTGRGTPLVPVSVALRGRDGGAIAELGDELAFALRASSGGGDKPHVMAFAQNQRDEVRTMDVAGALAAEPGAKQQTYVFHQGEGNGRMDGRTPQSTNDLPAGAVRGLWRCECGGASQERGLEGSSARESATPVQELPHEGAPVGAAVPSVRTSAQGSGLLRDALPAVEAPRRPGTQKDSACLQCGGVRISEPLDGVLQQARAAVQARHIGQAADDQERGRFNPMAVRRLTPVECERLQGFPDDFTRIPYRNKPAEQCPDGPRYKALGNSWAVPCARWIGERIAAVDAIRNANKEAA